MDTKLNRIISIIFIFVMFIGFSYALTSNPINLVYKPDSKNSIPTFNINAKTVDIISRSYSFTYFLDLKKYITNSNNLEYNLKITKSMQNVNCSINDKKELRCTIPKNFYGSGYINISLNYQYTKSFLLKSPNPVLKIYFNIKPINHSPGYNYMFPDGEFYFYIPNNGTNTFDLSGLFNDAEKITGYEIYNYQFVTKPELADCYIYANILNCSALQIGQEDLTLNVIDDQYVLPLHMHLMVLG